MEDYKATLRLTSNGSIDFESTIDQKELQQGNNDCNYKKQKHLDE